MNPKNLTFETTASEAAVCSLIYLHFIRGSMRSFAIIILITLVLAFALLFLVNEDPEIAVFERPLEALLILFGSFGSWMLMRYWNTRRVLLEDIGPRWRIALRLDPRGIHWLLKDGEESMEWNEFSEAKIFGGRLFLLPKEGGHIVIFARAFASRDEFEAYAMSVRSLINPSPAPVKP